MEEAKISLKKVWKDDVAEERKMEQAACRCYHSKITTGCKDIYTDWRFTIFKATSTPNLKSKQFIPRILYLKRCYLYCLTIFFLKSITENWMQDFDRYSRIWHRHFTPTQLLFIELVEVILFKGSKKLLMRSNCLEESV